jgi:DNA polymerase III delta subunit
MSLHTRRDAIAAGVAGIASLALTKKSIAEDQPIKAAEVRDFMRKIGGFSEKHLEGITDELLAKFKDAEKLVGLQQGNNVATVRYLTSGNHFTISNGVWSWLDGPGSQCYMSKAHSYVPKVGAYYQYRGECPNGAGSWYDINVV